MLLMKYYTPMINIVSLYHFVQSSVLSPHEGCNSKFGYLPNGGKATPNPRWVICKWHVWFLLQVAVEHVVEVAVEHQRWRRPNHSVLSRLRRTSIDSPVCARMIFFSSCVCAYPIAFNELTLVHDDPHATARPIRWSLVAVERVTERLVEFPGAQRCVLDKGGGRNHPPTLDCFHIENRETHRIPWIMTAWQNGSLNSLWCRGVADRGSKAEPISQLSIVYTLKIQKVIEFHGFRQVAERIHDRNFKTQWTEKFILISW